MKLAIFDIDGTLVKGSSERMFWRYLLRRGRQGPTQVFAYLLFLLRYLPTGGIHTLRKNKAYLTGLRTDEVEALARDFVAERLERTLFEPAVQRMRQHLNRGDTVVLMSGTLDAVARALAARLGIQHVVATLCSQRNGVFLAQPPEIHPFDAAKLSLARQLCREFKFDLRQVSAYADSSHDLFLLAAVGEAVAVRPDHRLLRAAQELGWEVMAERPAVSTLTS